MSFDTHVLSLVKVTSRDENGLTSTVQKDSGRRLDADMVTPRLRMALSLVLLLFALTAASECGELRLSPGDGSLHQNRSEVRLRWKGGQGVTHVFCGTDSSSLPLVAEIDYDSAFTITNPDSGATYFWRLVSYVNHDHPESTSVWSFEVSDIALVTRRFVPSGDPASMDDESDSRYEIVSKRVDLGHSALIVMDLWDSDLPTALSVIRMIEVARRHNIPVFFCTHEGVLHRGIEVLPWETSQDTPLDDILISRGITTLFYLGFDSGTCLTISRPNSIMPLTKRNPGVFDIVLIKDCTWSQSYPFHSWNVYGVESVWQSTTFRDLAGALGEPDQPESWEYWVYDWPYPLKENFGANLTPNQTAVLVVNAWAEDPNDGWTARIRRIEEEKISTLLKASRKAGYKVIHVLEGREPAPSCLPLPSEPVVGTQDSFWTYLSIHGIQDLIVAGNFHASPSSVFPLLDGWSLGFSGGGTIHTGFWGRTTFLDDCISVFEAPETLPGEDIKKAFLRRQTTAPGTWQMGTRHTVSGLDIYRSNTNSAPVFNQSWIAPALDGFEYSFGVGASDPDSAVFGDGVRFSLRNAPPWLSIDSTTGWLVGLPPIAKSTSADVEIEIIDNLAAATKHQFVLEMHHVNHPPVVMTPDPIVVAEDVPLSLLITGLDKDSVIGDHLHYSMLGEPSWLRLDQSSGSLFGTPGALNVETHVMSLIVTDDSGATASVSFPITVVHVNHAPVFDGTPASLATEDEVFTLPLHATDQDSALFHDRARYALDRPSTWLTIDPASGVVSGTPRITDLKDTLLTVIAIDDSGATDTLSLTIPIRHVNHAPVFASAMPVQATEDSLCEIPVHAADADSLVGDRIRYRLLFGPGWLTLDTLNGIATGIPGATDVGTGSFTLIAVDDSNATATLVVPFTVRHTNHAPVVVALPALSAVEDSLYASQIVASDADARSFGDSLRYTPVLKPAWLTLDSLTGTLSGIPRAGQLSETTLAVAISDGRGGLAQLSVSISISHTNHMPVFMALPTKSGDAVEDVAFSMSLAASDPDMPHFGDVLFYELITGPSWLAIDRGTGLVYGTPLEGDLDTLFTVRVSDGIAATSMTVPLSVQQVNDPPVLTGLATIVLNEDSSLSFDLAPFVHDPDNAPSMMGWDVTSPVTETRYWTALAPGYDETLSPGGPDSLTVLLDTTTARISIIASKNFNGKNIPVVVTVHDPDGLAATDTLFLTVVPVNDPPVLSAMAAITLAEDDSTLIPLTRLNELVTDPDDADSLLSWAISATGNVVPRWTPAGILISLAPDWAGMDSVTVRVTDREGSSDSMWVRVAVRPVNDHPVVAQVPDILIRGDSTVAIDLGRFISDIDDSSASLYADIRIDPSVQDGERVATTPDTKGGSLFPVQLSIDRTLHLTIDFPPSFRCLNLPVILRVFDAAGAEAADTLLLSIMPVLGAPVIHASIDTIATSGKLYTARVCVDRMENDDATIAYSLQGPSWLSIDSTGKISGTPTGPSENVVLVIAADEQGRVDSLQFKLVVQAGPESDIPSDYVLYQNYPNPFNPSTTIRFGLPEPSHVTGEIFNIVGQRVATLLTTELHAGYHTVQWSPTTLASGTYILVLRMRGLVSWNRDASLVQKVSFIK